MNLMPPNPVLISESVLRELDAAAPGTFYAQKKLDGRRRIVTRNADGSYTWRAKSKSAEDSQPVAAGLAYEFESMAWPCGVTLDVEYTGLRQTNGTPTLYVFDLLALDGQWCGGPFIARYRTLYEMWCSTVNVYMLPIISNPGMGGYYEALSSDPLCEGVVIRAAAQVNVPTRDRCRDGASIFKCKFR